MIGAVLIGGQSKRFGSDKAFYKIEGQALYKRQEQLLSKHCSRIYISCNQKQYEKEKFEQPLIDTVEDQGPVQGIIQALELATNNCLILACDLPNIEESEIDLLKENANETSISILVGENGIEQPLASVWPNKYLNDLKAFYERDERSIMKFLNEVGYRKLLVKSNKLLNLNKAPDSI